MNEHIPTLDELNLIQTNTDFELSVESVDEFAFGMSTEAVEEQARVATRMIETAVLDGYANGDHAVDVIWYYMAMGPDNVHESPVPFVIKRWRDREPPDATELFSEEHGLDTQEVSQVERYDLDATSKAELVEAIEASSAELERDLDSLPER